MSSIGWAALYSSGPPYALIEYSRDSKVEGVFADYYTNYGVIGGGTITNLVTTWVPVIPGMPYGGGYVGQYDAHPSGTLIIEAEIDGVPSTHRLLYVITYDYDWYNNVSYGFELAGAQLFWTNKVGTQET